jgi:hypothetical protein
MHTLNIISASHENNMQIFIIKNNKILNSNDNICVWIYILQQKSYSEICTAKCIKCHKLLFKSVLIVYDIV